MEHKDISLDTLAQMMSKGFEDMHFRFDILTREVVRLSDDFQDMKITQKSQSELLNDHEDRLQKLEI